MKQQFNLFIGGVLLILFSLAANAGERDSVVFNSKSSTQTWVVPKGVMVIHVDAYGAQGGGTHGGKGGHVQSDLKVNPGDKLEINVGSQPIGAESGYNGGGPGCGKGHGGGGATDIRIGGSELSTRVVVAGGGGGSGYSGIGGAGGGLIAGDGKYSDKEEDKTHLAYGGTQDAGGKGARAYFSKAGELGVGGEGINGRGECANGVMAGGGGGYYGGGAGGAGGAGGGSSYTNNKSSNVVHTAGVQEGNGKLVIYWDKSKQPY